MAISNIGYQGGKSKGQVAERVGPSWAFQTDSLRLQKRNATRPQLEAVSRTGKKTTTVLWVYRSPQDCHVSKHKLWRLRGRIEPYSGAESHRKSSWRAIATLGMKSLIQCSFMKRTTILVDSLTSSRYSIAWAQTQPELKHAIKTHLFDRLKGAAMRQFIARVLLLIACLPRP